MKKLALLILIISISQIVFAQTPTPDGKNWKHTGTNEFTKPITLQTKSLTGTKIDGWDATKTKVDGAVDASTILILKSDSNYQKPGSYTTRYDFKNEPDYPALKTLRALGSPVKIIPAVMECGVGVGSSMAMVTGTIYYELVYLRDTTVLSNFTYTLGVQGTYTASDYNGIGIFSFDGTNFTRISETVNDGNIWKTAIGAATTVNLPSPVTLVPGRYAIMILFNGTGGVAPTIYNVSGGFASNYGFRLADGVFFNGYSNTAGKTAFVTPVAKTSFYATSGGILVIGN